MGGSRNETIADCGLRNGNVSADRRAPLDRPTVALVRVAAALGEGKIDVLRDRFGAARAAGVPDRWIEELLLQSLLVVGYPLALVAFGVWREVSGPVSGPRDGGGEELGLRPRPASLGARPNVNTRGETVGELRVKGGLEK